MKNNVADIILEQLQKAIAKISNPNDELWVDAICKFIHLDNTAIAVSEIIRDEIIKHFEKKNKDELFSKVYWLNNFFSPIGDSLEKYKKNFDLIMSKNVYVSIVETGTCGLRSFRPDVWIEDKINGEYLSGTFDKKGEDED